METETFKKWHWRKNWQWFALTRAHTQLVAQDDYIIEIFRNHCRSGWDGEDQVWRDCFSDEHYISTLLAYHNK